MTTANLTVDAADDLCDRDTPAWMPLRDNPLLIAAGGECRGDIVATSDLIIHGQVHGDISAPGRQVFIMAQGAVEGSILAEGITIDGRLNGNCHAGALSIRAGGMFCGHASATLLQLEDGCIFRGTSRYQPSSRQPVLAQLMEVMQPEAAMLPPPDTLLAPDSPPHWMTTAFPAKHPWLLAAGALALGGVALTLTQRQTTAPAQPARTTVVASTPSATASQTPPQPVAVAPTPTPTPAPKPLADKQPAAAKPAATALQPARAPAVMPPSPQAIKPPRLTVPLPDTKPAAAVKPPVATIAPIVAPTVAPIAKPQTPPAAAPVPSAAPNTVNAMKESAWLAKLANWQTRELNMLIKASTRSRNSNQLSPLKGLIAQTAQQLMATRRLQRKYQPQQRIEPFIPDQATPMPNLSEAEIKKQHQQQLNALLAQADNDAFHADSQNLLTILRQTAGR